MKGIKRQPASLDGRPLNDPLREFYRNATKASLFDALCDRVALQHPESADEAILDSGWMRDKLTAVVGTSGCTKRHAERAASTPPMRVELPPPRVHGFDEMFRRIGDRIDDIAVEKPAHVDLNPTIAPGTIRSELADHKPVHCICGFRGVAFLNEDVKRDGFRCPACGVVLVHGEVGR